MKKFMLIGVLASLAACANVKPADDTDVLMQLPEKPTNCIYLYKVGVEAQVDSREDAIQYLKNRIAAEHKTGNSFWIETEDRYDNAWGAFRPKYKYTLGARVYDCSLKK